MSGTDEPVGAMLLEDELSEEVPEGAAPSAESAEPGDASKSLPAIRTETGILLRIAGDVQGYAYGSLLPGGAFDVMVLKGNLDFRYIWRALLRELARTVAPRAEYLNLEEDLGLPGLRENKLSYQPCELLERYQATLAGEAAQCSG